MGVITLFAASCAVGSCILAFQKANGWGAAFIGFNVVGMIGSFAVAFRLLPKSPLAIGSSQVEAAKNVSGDEFQKLLGATGVAFTDLRPGGTAMIGERKVDVVAQGAYIDQGAKIKVLKVEGTKVVVERETV
jgi:membrane-bound serine protease (ClpP class)